MKQYFHSICTGVIVMLFVMVSPNQVPVATGLIVMHITWMHYEKSA